MRKKLVKLIIFLMLVMPCYVCAEEISYDTAQNIVKEVMQAWYMRGMYRQYNSSKNLYFEINHPEDSTSQDMGYTVCTGFTDTVYQESFGTMAERNETYSGTKIPTVSKQYCLHTEDYITQKDCHTGEAKEGCNGEYALYFENKEHDYKKPDKTIVHKPAASYYYNVSEHPTVEEFAENINPGDLFVYYSYDSSKYSYTGHAMIAYDVAINPNTGKKDVLLLQSSGGGTAAEIKTKIDPTDYSTRRLFYRKAQSNDTNNLISLNSSGSLVTNEGTINNAKWLSDVSQFVNSEGKISCKVTSCSVSRFFYKDSNNFAKFNYDVQDQQIKNSITRTKLPGIFIHKTSDAFDNNSVYPEQTITYTIEIANQSNVRMNGASNYIEPFYVSEVIPTDKVDFVSSTMNGKYNDGKITWTINSLDAGKNITLTYTVKVKNTEDIINKKIDAKGTVYIDNTGSITTGVVSNTIIKKPATKKDSYQNCYNKYKDSKKELELIDEVYNCVYGVDLKLTKFSTNGEDNNMFSKLIEHTLTSSGSKTGEIKIINNDVTKNYYDMILNDYWNSNILIKGTSYYLAPWRDSYRADTVYNEHFKDGDVLIYLNDDTYTKDDLKFTQEQGVYAYIYLDGKFVGQNNVGDTSRNEFTYEYYPDTTRKANLINSDLTDDELAFVNYETLFGKDYYVILRPEKIIQSSGVDIVVPNTKMNKLVVTSIISLVIISIGLIMFRMSKKSSK